MSELAILVTARHWSSEYEWQAHEIFARQAGMAPAIIESIQHDNEPSFEKDDESIVYRFAHALLNQRKIPPAIYQEASNILGSEKVVDLVGVLGYYSLISMTINVFEVDPPGPNQLDLD